MKYMRVFITILDTFCCKFVYVYKYNTLFVDCDLCSIRLNSQVYAKSLTCSSKLFLNYSNGSSLDHRISFSNVLIFLININDGVLICYREKTITWSNTAKIVQ